MKNADKPMHPAESMFNNGVEFFEHSSPNGRSYPGITKREYFAALAMQGLLSSGNGVDDGDGVNTDPVLIASASISYADELLKQLES